MKEEKKQGGVPFSSISKFFMTDCECEQSTNGYFSWRCVTGNCKQCQNNQYPLLSGEKTNPLVTFSQFELTNTPTNKKINKETSQKKFPRKLKEYIIRYYLMNVLASLNQLNILTYAQIPSE